MMKTNEKATTPSVKETVPIRSSSRSSDNGSINSRWSTVNKVVMMMTMALSLSFLQQLPSAHSFTISVSSSSSPLTSALPKLSSSSLSYSTGTTTTTTAHAHAHAHSDSDPDSIAYSTEQQHQQINSKTKAYSDINYLYETTHNLLNPNITPYGSLTTNGKYHQLHSILRAWSNVLHDSVALSNSNGNTNNDSYNNIDNDGDDSYGNGDHNVGIDIYELGTYFVDKMNNIEDTNTGTNTNTNTNTNDGIIMPVLLMEAILIRITKEQEAMSMTESVKVVGLLSTELYNIVIDAWCLIATSTTVPTIASHEHEKDDDQVLKETEYYEFQMSAIQRSFDIVQQLQSQSQMVHQDQNLNQQDLSSSSIQQLELQLELQPNLASFQCIIEAYAKLAISLSLKLTSITDSTATKTGNTNTNTESRIPSNNDSRHRHRKEQQQQQQQQQQQSLQQKIKKTTQKAHYTLLNQEYLYRTNQNTIVKPTIESYTTVMDMYSKSNLSTTQDEDGVVGVGVGVGGTITRGGGQKTEEILRLMDVQGHIKPNTFCYNLVISAYMNEYFDDTIGITLITGDNNKNSNSYKSRRRRDYERKKKYRYRKIDYSDTKEENFNSILHAQRIFDELQNNSKSQSEMDVDVVEGGIGIETEVEVLQPDIISYTSLITSWVTCNKKYEGVQKAQELLFQMEDEYYRSVELLESSSSDDTTPVPVRPNTYLYNTVLKAWCRMNDPIATENALLLFQRLKKMYRFQLKEQQKQQQQQQQQDEVVVEEGNYSSSRTSSSRSNDLIIAAKPDRTSFNTMLHVLSKHATQESLQQAENILVEMQMYEERGYFEWSPNLFSYNTIIEGYSKRFKGSNQKKFGTNDDLSNNFALKAYRILQKVLIARKKQQKKKEENKSKNKTGGTSTSSYQIVSPDTFSFNNVIFALSKSRLKQSALLIEELLLFMEKEHIEKSNRKIRPDVYSYSSAIAAWARSGECDAGSRAEALLLKMEERYTNGEKALKPNVVTFNSVIDCYAKSRQGKAGARKAEQILERMECMYSAGDDAVQPNVNTYNSVLSAWAKSNTRCAHLKSQAVLEKMWKMYEAGNEGVKPDSHAYNTVISAVSRSQEEDKAQKALRLLRQMDKLYRDGGKQNQDVRPNEITYTCVLNSCAYSIGDNQDVRRKALDTAIFTLEELMESPYGRPNHVTYGMFLACCKNLIPSNDMRRRIKVIEPVFLQCCKDGQVNELVLNQLRLAAPDDLYEKLLGKVISNGRTKRVRIEDIPAEWKCNVRNEKWQGGRRRTSNRKYISNRNRLDRRVQQAKR